MTTDVITVLQGDCIEVMRGLPAESFDAVVTDPPYGLEFMGKDWDKFGRDTGPGYKEKPRIISRPDEFSAFNGKSGQGVNSYQAGKPYQRWTEEWAAECLRLLKPGGHLLSFGGTRTSHRLACAIEDAGFEIRDSIAWLYGSGFPKSKTVLKPAHEPIIVARKPFKGTEKANVATYGTGALSVEATRIDMGDEYDPTKMQRQRADTAGMKGLGSSGFDSNHEQATYNASGRWPANVVLDEFAASELDSQTGILTSGKMMPTRTTAGVNGRPNAYGADSPDGFTTIETYGDSGGASRFFYVAKAPAKERPRGEDGTAHPTVKPLTLMRWLVKLVTPEGGHVLDPFAGTGTTGEACFLEGFRSTLIEKDESYIPLIHIRLGKHYDR